MWVVFQQALNVDDEREATITFVGVFRMPLFECGRLNKTAIRKREYGTL